MIEGGNSEEAAVAAVQEKLDLVGFRSKKPNFKQLISQIRKETNAAK